MSRATIVDRVKPKSYELSCQLWKAWVSFDVNHPVPPEEPAFSSRAPVALRARHHILRHPAGNQDPRWFKTSFDTWTREVELVEEGEAAIMAGQLVDARARFTELFELAQQEDAHPARLVDALIGLGDVSRTEEKLDVAESRYREAVRVSDRYNMPFGRIRATVPLFHLQQGNVASLDILSSTNEILAEAKCLGDKTYVANIEMIRAEAFTRIREFERAMEAANAAEEQFDGNIVGLAGLYIRLADQFRMREDEELLHKILDRLFGVLREAPLTRERSDALDLKAAWHIMRGELEEAAGAATEAVEIAKSMGYQFGVIYARTTLSQIHRKNGDLEEALHQRNLNIDFFQSTNMLKTQLSYSLIERAEILIDLKREKEATSDVVESIGALESLRCEQSSPRSQYEYRNRFAQIYRRSLQAACDINSPHLFITAFEGIWGRRLAGLTERPAHINDNALLMAQMLAQSQLAEDDDKENEDGEGDTSTTLMRRILGRLTAQDSSSEKLDEESAADLASLSHPYNIQSAKAHLAEIPPGTAALFLAPVPERPELVAHLIIDHTGSSTCSVAELPDETVRAIAALHEGNHYLTHQELSRFSRIIPSEILRLPPGTPTLLVPLEELWPIPWPAIPLQGTAEKPLGQRHPLKLCPSLSVATAVRRRSFPAERRVRAWIGPDVLSKESWPFKDSDWCHSSTEILEALTNGTPNQDAVVVAHGVPAEGITHALVLDEGKFLTPFEAMIGTPPGRVGLLTCWSAHTPIGSSGDPLNVATVMLARGANSVLATSAELADDSLSGIFAGNVIHDVSESDWGRSLQRAITRFSRTEPFQEDLSRWAPLRVLGAW